MSLLPIAPLSLGLAVFGLVYLDAMVRRIVAIQACPDIDGDGRS